MDITFWGTRGSIASPGRDTLRFGGNTACVEISAGGQTFIFDAGTGIRLLGNHLIATRQGEIGANLFISHVHWDHIQGFPFFGPLFVSGNAFNVFGPQEQVQRLSETLAGQMQYRYFPIDLDQLNATVHYAEVREETLKFGAVHITSRYMNHTTLTMAYRLQMGQRSVVYATDTEPFSQQARAWSDSSSRHFHHRRDEELAEFFAGADVLIMDSQYSLEEYPGKVGWGHGTPDYAMDLALSAGVKTLVLYHHDPMRTDDAVEKILKQSQERARNEGGTLTVEAAAEGKTITLEDEPGPSRTRDLSPMPTFHPRVNVALIGTDEVVTPLAERALAQTQYQFKTFRTVEAATSSTLIDFRPHMILLQTGGSGDVANVQRHLQAKSLHYRALPLLALLPEPDDGAVEQAFEEGATDVIAKPFTASQLRSRVDSWLFRSNVAIERRQHARASLFEAAGAS